MPLSHIAVLERRRIPIKTDLRAFVVGLHGRVSAAQNKVAEDTHCVDVADGVVSVISETRLTAVGLDIFGHLEGNGKLACTDADAPVVEFVLVVGNIGHAIGIRHGDVGLPVVHGHPKLAVEKRVNEAV